MYLSEEQKLIILILLIAAITAAATVIFIRQKKYCRRYEKRENIDESCDTFISCGYSTDDKAELYDTVELSQGTTVHIVLLNKKNGEKYFVNMYPTGKKCIVIGRSRECDVTLSGESTVSGHHCRLILAGGSILAEDLDSTNKTYLNGRPVLQPQLVKKGDVLILGHSELMIADLEEEK